MTRVTAHTQNLRSALHSRSPYAFKNCCIIWWILKNDSEILEHGSQLKSNICKIWDYGLWNIHIQGNHFKAMRKHTTSFQRTYFMLSSVSGWPVQSHKMCFQHHFFIQNILSVPCKALKVLIVILRKSNNICCQIFSNLTLFVKTSSNWAVGGSPRASQSFHHDALLNS